MIRYFVSVMSIAIVSAAAVMATRTDGAAHAADDSPPYTVQDGNKVDQKTLDGWKTWRALACERCHGAEQEGLVGPSLVNSLKTMSKEDFHTTVINGRAEKGMPPWGGSDLMVKTAKVQFPIKIAAAGMHNIRNALAAIACTMAIGVQPAAVKTGLESFEPVSGRLQRKTSTIGSLVIDDTYNANPDSVRAAIDVLANAGAPRVLVLGDMGEVGNEGKKFHEEIGAYARGRNIDALLTLGELTRHCCTAFGSRGKHFDNVEQLQQALQQMLTPTTTVLVKGSRFMKMERVVNHLTGKEEQGTH